MLRKWNFVVNLSLSTTHLLFRLNISYIIMLYVIRLNISLNDKWVVERLKFGSYCMINCGKTNNDIFPEFLVFHCLVSGWPHIWSWRVYCISFSTDCSWFSLCFLQHTTKVFVLGNAFHDRNWIDPSKVCKYNKNITGRNVVLTILFS